MSPRRILFGDDSVEEYATELVCGLRPSEEFEYLAKVGKGSFATVWKARHLPSGKLVAIKKCKFEKKTEEEQKDYIMKEVRLLSELHHENVVKVFACFESQGELCIVEEFCAAASMRNIITKMSCIREMEIVCVLKQVVRALLYLHEREIIHRDIKAANLLLNSDGIIKIADFGISTQCEGDRSSHHTMIGSPYWMSPEIIQDTGYSTPADIWALGITVIELAEGEPPLIEHPSMRVIFIIPTRDPPTLEEPRAYSPELIDFLSRCLVKEPSCRATAAELLSHPLLLKRDTRDNAPLRDLARSAISASSKRDAGVFAPTGSPVATSMSMDFSELPASASIDSLRALPGSPRTACPECSRLRAKVALLEDQVAELKRELYKSNSKVHLLQDQSQIYQRLLEARQKDKESP